jgi:hypothetical protein
LISLKLYPLCRESATFAVNGPACESKCSGPEHEGKERGLVRTTYQEELITIFFPIQPSGRSCLLDKTCDEKLCMAVIDGRSIHGRIWCYRKIFHANKQLRVKIKKNKKIKINE